LDQVSACAGICGIQHVLTNLQVLLLKLASNNGVKRELAFWLGDVGLTAIFRNNLNIILVSFEALLTLIEPVIPIGSDNRNIFGKGNGIGDSRANSESSKGPWAGKNN
jgi:hypothetical protein